MLMKKIKVYIIRPVLLITEILAELRHNRKSLYTQMCMQKKFERILIVRVEKVIGYYTCKQIVLYNSCFY